MNLKRLIGDDLTVQLMSLLQKLMKFRFYTSAQQMRGVVRPILRTLDDRRRFGTDSNQVTSEDNKRGVCFFPHSAISCRYSFTTFSAFCDLRMRIGMLVSILCVPRS